MLRMAREARLSLAAGETLQLRSGDRHIMLFGLLRQLVPGERVSLCVITADKAEVCTRALVTVPGAGAQQWDH